MAERYEGYRGEGGRLLPGHPGGPGRPARTREAEIYQMLLEIFDEPTRLRFVKAQQEKLAAGNNAAWREIAKYLLPTVQRTEHTGADGEPLFRLSDIVSALQAMETGQQPPAPPPPGQQSPDET